MTLQRRTPIARGAGTSLTRTPMRRGAPLRARAGNGSARTTARNTGPSATVRALVNQRDTGMCVRCGQPARDLDHRRGRGMGGTKGDTSTTINGPAWLVTLCGHGNTSGCHGWKETNAEDAARDGYRILRSSRVDAASVPVRTRHGWMLATDDGGWVAVGEPPGGDARNAG